MKVAGRRILILSCAAYNKVPVIYASTYTKCQAQVDSLLPPLRLWNRTQETILQFLTIQHPDAAFFRPGRAR